MKVRIWNSALLITAVGLTGMVVSSLADVIGIGHSGFGRDQLAGLILGAFAFLAGLVKLYAINKRKIGRILACFYIIGVLYVGLIPNPGGDNRVEIFWEAKRLFSRDFFINTIGFIMVGYLLMLSLENKEIEHDVRQLLKKAALVMLTGGMVSLLLELSQYLLIHGRAPSSADLSANVIGTAIGILLYVFGPARNKEKLVHIP